MKIDRTKPIYGTIYGGHCQSDKTVVLIKPEELQYEDNPTQQPYMLFIWGWPGPDFNVYRERDYGQTWAYNLEDFETEVIYNG